MAGKKCAACGKPVGPGTGTYRHGRLVHKECESKAEAFWFAGRGK